MNTFLTIDVEEWFMVENLSSVINQENWQKYESRVQKSVDIILESLDEFDSKATFFILGWIAERNKPLVRKIAESGHEIASHGYSHKILTSMSEDEIRDDVLKTKKILEDISGYEILGYRAPCFSITEKSIDILKDSGYRYDSSFFPFSMHDRYGIISGINDNSINEIRSGFLEFPMTVRKMFNKKIPWSGGGYFRLYPFSIFKNGVKKILEDYNYFLLYLHPWEFDENQPKVKGLKPFNSFRHYNNIEKTESRFKKLLKEYKFSSIISCIK